MVDVNEENQCFLSLLDLAKGREFDRYLLELLERAEGGQFDQLKSKVERELGLIYHGVLKDVERTDDFRQCIPKADVLPPKALDAGVYVSCQRRPSMPALPLLALDNIPDARWTGVSGDRARTGCTSKQDNAPVQTRQFESKRAGKYSLRADVYFRASSEDCPRRCFVLHVKTMLPLDKSTPQADEFMGNEVMRTPGEIDEEWPPDKVRDRAESPTRGDGDAETPSSEVVRVLFVQFCASQRPDLNLEREKVAIRAAWDDIYNDGGDFRISYRRRILDMDDMQGASLRHVSRMLQASLATNQFYDYIHFSGHGKSNMFKTLEFASTYTKNDGVVATDLGFASIICRYQDQAAHRIDGSKPLRGVVLNCCHGINQGQALCDSAGVPRVVAHEGEVKDSVATEFAAALYTGIAVQNDVELAFDFAKGELEALSLPQNYKLLAPTPQDIKDERLEVARQDSKTSERTRRFIDEQYENDKVAMNSRVSSEGKKLRQYQQEVLDASRERNSLVCLPTGAGKSAVAFTRMIEIAEQREYWPRKIAFLTPTVPLMFQQSRAFARFSGVVEADIGKYCGDVYRIADDNMAAKRFVFFTGGLFHALLEARPPPFRVSDFCLLVFDEAHHCKGRHVYRRIMTEFYFTTKPVFRPRVIGLSATPATEKEHIEDVCADLGESVLVLPESPEAITELKEVCSESQLEAKILELTKDESYIEQVMVAYLNNTLLQFVDLVEPTKADKLRQALKSESPWSEVLAEEESPRGASSVEQAPTMQQWIGALDEIKTIAKDAKPTVSCVLEHAADVCEHFSEFVDIGSGAALRAMHRCLKDLITNKYSERCEKASRHELDYFHALLVSVGDDEVLEGLRSSGFAKVVENLTSSKFKRLREVLLDEMVECDLTRDDPQKRDRILIFVQTRSTCKHLADALNNFFRNEIPNAPKCDYVVGHGSSSPAKMSFSLEELENDEDDGQVRGMDAGEQREKVEQFESGEVPVLVSTSVLEEGIDVGWCRLVIRYDDAMTVTALKQSRGRARAREGKTILLTFNPNAIEEYYEKERAMLRAIEQAETPQPDKPLRRRFFEEDAKSILAKYCGRFTSKKLEYTTTRDTSPLVKRKNTFTSTLVVPPGCDLNREWGPCGQPRASKPQAENAVAYKVCVYLLEHGKLDKFAPGLEYYKSISGKNNDEITEDTLPPASQSTADQIARSSSQSKPAASRVGDCSAILRRIVQRTSAKQEHTSGMKINELKQRIPQLVLTLEEIPASSQKEPFCFVFRSGCKEVGVRATGRTKKEARELAAASALKKLSADENFFLSLCR